MAIETALTRLVGCHVPIQNAGMGMASPALGIAVARAGGLGMISGTSLSPDSLQQLLGGIDAQTRRTMGINFLNVFLEDDSVVDIAANYMRVIEFFYDTPDTGLIKRVHDNGALCAWQVGSLAEAKAAAEAGCDLIIIQGMEAGGHVRGTVGLMPLLTEVLEHIDTPVIAAGGIANARGLASVISAGAAGARIGTRFVATPESGYHEKYIQKLIDASSEDTVYTEKFSVMWPNAPHRVLKSCIEAADNCAEDIVGQLQLGDQTVDVPRYSVMGPLASATGNIDAMALYAGQGVGLVNNMQPAAEIMAELVSGAEAILKSNS